MIGIDWTALPAAEQFLFARYFMYRTVYYHKTTFGMEETFRQLLRRCQQREGYSVPSDGDAIRALVAHSAGLVEFTDHFADAVARKALAEGDHVISRLAEVVVHRKPPKLLREEVALVDTTQESERKHNACTSFLQACRRETKKLATDNKLPLGLFFVTQVPPIRLERRGPLIPATEASGQPGEKEDELIKVFRGTEAEPKSLVDIPESLIKHCAHRVAYIVRLYAVEYDDRRVKKLREAVRAW